MATDLVNQNMVILFGAGLACLLLAVPMLRKWLKKRKENEIVKSQEELHDTIEDHKDFQES